MSSSTGAANQVKEVVVDEYPAGKFKLARTLEDGGLSMEALPDQGKLLFQRIRESNQLEFVWKRATGLGTSEVREIPAGSTFERIDTGNTVDRVYLLCKDKTTDSFRHFFWLQEKDKAKDRAFVDAVQRCLRNPAAAPALRTLTNIDQTMERILSSFQENQSTIAVASGAVQNEFTNLLPNLDQRGQNRQGRQLTPSDVQAALAGVTQSMRQPPINLLSVMNSDEIRPLIEDKQIQNELIPLLPPEMQTIEELKQTITSPQFKQAVAALSGALQSENFGTVFANFGLDPRDGAAALNVGDGIRAFLLALQAKVDRENNPNTESNNRDTMEDDEFYN